MVYDHSDCLLPGWSTLLALMVPDSVLDSFKCPSHILLSCALQSFSGPAGLRLRFLELQAGSVGVADTALPFFALLSQSVPDAMSWRVHVHWAVQAFPQLVGHELRLRLDSAFSAYRSSPWLGAIVRFKGFDSRHHFN